MPLTARRALGAITIAVGLLLTIASAPALADATSCSAPTLTQPFSTWGDYNLYALVPGQSPGNFDGTGWVLGNGAKLVTAPAQNGVNTTLLAMQSGGWAVSPPMCVDPSYQTERMMVRSVYGSPSIDVSVSYQDASGGWSPPQDMGETSTANTWRPSAVLGFNPPAQGWQIARFTLSADGRFSRAQLYDVYIDPYSRG